jgi:serine protease Do
MKRVLVLLIAIVSIPICALTDIIDDASRYTVRVRTSIEHAFGEDEAGTIYGAGFLVDLDNRYVVTNAHVSGRGNANIEIAFNGSGYEGARAVYVDPVLDLAILQIESETLPVEAMSAKIECSDRYLNGVAVAAYGHPHGLSFSASRGIISQVRTYEGNDWVQTDAAINPGNSGGALIDLTNGNVVGVNASSVVDTEGLNFAVPILPVCSIIKLLKAGINPSPPALPLIFATNDELNTHLTIAGNNYGPLPEGIKAGDFLETVNGIKVSSPDEVGELLRGFTGNAEVGLMRDGERLKATIEVQTQEAVLERDFILMDGTLISTDLFVDRRMQKGYFQIHSIEAGSLSEQSDLQSYQLIISVNGETPSSLQHLFELLNGSGKLDLIMRSWSDVDIFLNKYLHVNYTPQDISYHAK